ncbi:MAG: glycerophosphodiester phosphodiesterase family protein, partial [Gammaproteobacteria bacterium]
MTSARRKSVLVGHRGDAIGYPENSLAAFESAARLGLHYVELDVQVTADGVPIVLHDASLERTHNLDVTVTKATLQELGVLGVLTGGHHPPAVPRLAEFVEWMRKTPQIHVFVEIKKESLHAHGRERVLAAVTQAIETIRGRAVIISYDARVLAMAKRERWPIGYVLLYMTPRYQVIADRLAPEYLFAEYPQLL